MKIRIAIVLGVIAGALSAQNINKFVISDEAAKKTLIKYEISADTAAKITQACVDFATKNNMAVSVFILSPTGQIVHAHRMDGQVPINTETALLKAQSVLYTRDSTHARANQVANNVALAVALGQAAGVSDIGRIADHRRRADDRSDWRGRRESGRGMRVSGAHYRGRAAAAAGAKSSCRGPGRRSKSVGTREALRHVVLTSKIPTVILLRTLVRRA